MTLSPREIADLFDARAPRYAHDDWHRRYAERFVAAIPLPPGAVVLDAGTGTGFAARAIARRIGPGGRVIGVDLSAGMLEQARSANAGEGLTNIELRQGDVTNLDIESGTLDAVLCCAGLLYMPVERALREFHRVLKPNGLVAFSTVRAGSPSAGRLFRECAAEFGVTLEDKSEALGSEDRCRRALEDAGFETLDVIPDHVAFDVVDLELAWEANFRSAGHAALRVLSPEQQHALKARYLAAMRELLRTDGEAATSADVLYAIGRPVAGTLSRPEQ